MNKQTLIFYMIIILCLLLSVFCIVLPLKIQGLEGNCENTYNASKECPCLQTKFNNSLINFSSLTNISIIKDDIINFSIKLV